MDIIRKADALGIRIAVIPASYLSDIKADIKEFALNNKLNDFQKWIVEERYILDVPKTDFEVRSIVIAVWPCRLIKTSYQYKGRTVHGISDDIIAKTDKNDILRGIFKDAGYQLLKTDWLPLKRLAVRAGLTGYGRNNITYAKDWGSFIRIGGYISDMPSKKGIWRDVKNMDICDTCGMCIGNCPTCAIDQGRFLIDNEKCLSCMNEYGTEDFPDWVPTTAHHRIYECIKCQEICPVNMERLRNITESIEFSEEETEIILTNHDLQSYPSLLKAKLWFIDNGSAMECIGRNLKAMFDNPEMK
jgi:epoxyqueuosine reductase